MPFERRDAVAAHEAVVADITRGQLNALGRDVWGAGSGVRRNGFLLEKNKVVKMSEFAWCPTPEIVERAQLTKFLRSTVSRDFTELHQRSISDVPWFTEQVLRFLNIRFDEPYTSVLDLSRRSRMASTGASMGS